MFVVGDAVCGTDALCHVALAFIAFSVLVTLTLQAHATLRSTPLIGTLFIILFVIVYYRGASTPIVTATLS